MIFITLKSSVHSQLSHRSRPCYQIGGVPINSTLAHVSSNLHSLKKQKLFVVCNMNCARQICLWSAGEGWGTSESAVFEANANLSKELIFDFFQISETHCRCRNTRRWRPSCFCLLNIWLNRNLMLYPLTFDLEKRTVPADVLKEIFLTLFYIANIMM